MSAFARARFIAAVGAAAFAMGLVGPTVSTERTARAETPPDVWSRARDPGAKERWELHLEARRAMRPPETGFPSFAALELAHARELLERAHVQDGSDAVLLFDLGIVYEKLELHDKAIAVLEPALAKLPDDPASDAAWLNLAFAYAKVDRPADERRCYLAFLARSTEPDERAVALLNFAETEMRLGRLREAIVAYRDAIDDARQHIRSSDTYVLAVWGLAVALDRYGDLSLAQKTAEEATRLDMYDRLIADRENVFFVPAYERSWYLGLGLSARSRSADDPRLAALFAQKAEAQWTQYVAQATAKDRWKSLAEKRLAAAKRERQRLDAKVRTLPKKPTPEDETAY